MTSTMPRTYEEAIAMGYTPTFTSLQRGYVSRKMDMDIAPVMVAGGNRKGMLYVLLPCWQSTQYCVRQYLTK